MHRTLILIFILFPAVLFAQWEYVEPMPTAREGLTVAELDGRIYAIGGRDDWFFTGLDVVEIYDPVTNSWTAGPAIRYPRIYASAAVHNGKIFLFGGRNGFVLVNEIEMFDPAEGHWEEIGYMFSREGLSATTYGDSIIVLGGKTSFVNYSPFANIYDPVNIVWGDSLPNYPILRAGHGAVAVGDSLYIMGGVGYGMLSNVSVYDGHEWQEGPELPLEIGNTGAAVLNGDIYLVGGTTDDGGIFTWEPSNITLTLANSDLNWIAGDTLNTSRDFHGVVVCNNKLYAIGGGQGDFLDRDFLSSVEVLQLPTTGVDPSENPSSGFTSFSVSNYPNPFSQVTSIEINYPLNNINTIPIVIYNIAGREVMRWNRPSWQQGQLSLTWNGIDNYGNPLPSGTYFLKIAGQSNTKTQKITIVR